MPRKPTAAGAVAWTGATVRAVLGFSLYRGLTMPLSDMPATPWDALDFQKKDLALVLSPYHRRDLMAQTPRV